MTSISAVIPAYNEERIIASTVEAVDDTLSRLVDDHEVIVVNDGSRDATPRIVAELARQRPTVRQQRPLVRQPRTVPIQKSIPS